MGAAKEGANTLQKTRTVPRGQRNPEPSVRDQRKDLGSRLFPEEPPKQPSWLKWPRLARDHPSMSTSLKAARLVDGVEEFQGCRLQLRNGGDKDMEDLKGLKPNHGSTEAEPKCKQKHHHLAWERLEGTMGTCVPQPTPPIRGAPSDPGKVVSPCP